MWIAFDRINGDFELFPTEAEAQAHAADYLKYYENHANDTGWPEDMEGSIGYGPITASTEYTILVDRKDYTDEQWAEECYSDEFSHVARCELVSRKE